MAKLKLPGGSGFWNFGAFPVLAAAAFQLAIIFQSVGVLGEFFLLQSIVAVGLSLVCLQPRTWNANMRSASRLRWSCLFSLAFLVAVGIYFVFVPWNLGILVAAFLAKKSCDVGREFVFLGELRGPLWLIVVVTVLEVGGILLLLPGFLLLAALLYSAAGFLLIGWALWATRNESWAINWAFKEIPHSFSMTLFNMGARVFLVSVPAPTAHLTIGSILQVVNFLSPVTYAIFSRSRLLKTYIIGLSVSAVAVLCGAYVFIRIGGGLETDLWYLVCFVLLLCFNSSAVIRVSADASVTVRTWLGISISCWVGLGALLGLSDLLDWENSFILFLVGNALILLGFRGTIWFSQRTASA